VIGTLYKQEYFGLDIAMIGFSLFIILFAAD
jgi:hypothetical protein